MPLVPVFDPVYRFWHLRRVWQLALIAPMLGVILATWHPLGTSWLTTPHLAAGLLAVWAVIAALHLICWPRHPVEVLAWSLTLGAGLGLAPVIMGLGAVAAAVLLIPLLALACHRVTRRAVFSGPLVGHHFHAACHSDLAPAHIVHALRLTPGTSDPFRQTGPGDAQGQFLHTTPVPPELNPAAGDVWETRARVVDESALHQLQALIPLDEPHKETRILLRAEASGHGSRVTMDEFETGLPLGCAVLFGLIGLHEDTLRARIDHSQGLPSRTIRAAAGTSPLDGLRLAGRRLLAR